MDDQEVRLATYLQVSFEQYADPSNEQIYLLDRYIQPPIIPNLRQTHSFIELAVGFIKRRPTSELELVFKDEAGVKHKSSKFKEGHLVNWNLDMFVRFAAQSHRSQSVINSVY